MNKKAIKGEGSLDILYVLRAIAVLMVCFCHFGKVASINGNNFSKLFSYFEKYGKYGVEIFFVISGFVIPLSLSRGKYTIENYPKFLLKRVVRLHPPYIAALILTLTIMFISYKVRHVVYPENVLSIFQSLFYLHVPSDNPVFWTLLIEAQYYLFIGLFFTLITRMPKFSILVFVPFFLLFSMTLVADYIELFKFIEYFLMGTVGYCLYSKTGDKYINNLVLVLILSFITFKGNYVGLFFSFSTLVIILFINLKVSKAIKFLGIISYSIYLIHFPIGMKLMNFMKPRINDTSMPLLFLLALIVSIACSWVFYILFEAYSEKLSKKIKYTQ
ncbi:acyltransferase family protein [Flavobacterium faecale]|nr:acyltransferase [Flavobacterium faecale]